MGIDIFCGAGGMSLGAQMAGIKISLAIELDEKACLTYEHNHPQVNLLKNDIRKISPTDYVDNNPFVLFGGPPCQGFSFSNRQTRNLDNEYNSLFTEFIRFTRELEPNWFVFENVEGFNEFYGGVVVKKLEEEFRKLGYRTSKNVLCSSKYGVPQSRKRFFMVGNKLGIKFEFPDGNQSEVSVKEAICDLPDLINGDNREVLPYKTAKISTYSAIMRKDSEASTQNYVSRNQDYVVDRYKYIKPGQNWQAIPEHLMINYKNKKNCHSGIYKRLHPERPSVVIANYRKNMLIHPYQDRGLSVREAARIQSFPDSFVFCGTINFIQQQIGNAVPPLLAKAIFSKMLEYSDG